MRSGVKIGRLERWAKKKDRSRGWYQGGSGARADGGKTTRDIVDEGYVTVKKKNNITHQKRSKDNNS